jgi:hypothetical protein
MPVPDDAVVPDWELLIRRVVINKNSVKVNQEGGLQFTTAGFKLDADGVSVYRAQVLHLLGLTPSDAVGGKKDGVPVGIMAGHARAAGAGIVPDPVPVPTEVSDPAHALVKVEGKPTLYHVLERAFILSRTVVVQGTPPEVVVVEVREREKVSRRRGFSRLWFLSRSGE